MFQRTGQCFKLQIYSIAKAVYISDGRVKRKDDDSITIIILLCNQNVRDTVHRMSKMLNLTNPQTGLNRNAAKPAHPMLLHFCNIRRCEYLNVHFVGQAARLFEVIG